MHAPNGQSQLGLEDSGQSSSIVEVLLREMLRIQNFTAGTVG